MLGGWREEKGSRLPDVKKKRAWRLFHGSDVFFIDGSAGEEEELAKLAECLDKASTAYGMEISAEKTKLMTNNTSGINTEIKVNGQRLETLTSFKYLGSVITDEGSKPEIVSRIAQTTSALTRLKPVWNDSSIPLSSKIQLMHSLVTSIFLYACGPQYYSELLHLYTPSRDLRSSADTSILKIPHSNFKAFGQRSFSHVGHSTWNGLPYSLRHSDSQTSFR